MKKRFLIIALSALMALGAFALAGCGGSSSDSGSTSPSGDISVYSREDGSGTRGAFVELFGIEQEENGEKVDKTTDKAVITNSTSVMMTSVAGDSNGIGYISLGSLDDSVKALKVDGVEATAENVKSGDYKIARPFNIVTKDGLSEQAQDFITYIMSSDGQKVIEDNGYISVAQGEAYKASGASGKIVVAGSSSVTPVMEKLAEAYQELNPDVNIEVQQSDSTTGIQMATEGTCDIGMASRDLKDSETGVETTVIAQDGIAVIVNKDASITDITSDQVKAIYLGDVTTWEDALAI
ncbi:MAG: substrate-binding domain-containing protein [Eggerthellaceae bacterium]|jgi:phosphate transport system substrate-binding protein